MDTAFRRHHPRSVLPTGRGRSLYPCAGKRSTTGQVVQRALDRLKRISSYTTVVIAHRLSTIKDADRIAVIANKGIAELGTHAELTGLNGLYSSLCAAQVSRVGASED